MFLLWPGHSVLSEAINNRPLLLPGASLVVLLQCRPGFVPWVRQIPWRRKWHPTPALLPGKPHGWRSLVGCSPWGRTVGHDWATALFAFCSSPVAYWAPSNLGAHFLVSHLFAFSYCSRASRGKNTAVVCHFLLQRTTFHQNSSL